MSYPFVQAKYYTKGGLKEARAIALHMAEGTGTVSWLTHPTNDNSSHFVVERSGRAVQMVRYADADHSLHVDRPYGPPGPGDCGIFSLNVARDLLGAGIADPNAYLVAVEIEGWAAPHYSTAISGMIPAGPNAEQVVSLRRLIDDIVAHYGTIRGLLGHRDFQDYKACPGCSVFDSFPHGAFIGAGPIVPIPEDPMAMGPFPVGVRDEKVAAVKVGAQLYELDLSPRVTASNVPEAKSPYRFRTGGINYRVCEVLISGTVELVLAKEADCTLTDPPATDPVDCTPLVAAATALIQDQLDAANQRALDTAAVLRNQATLLGG